jgi:hypothetical protein
MAFSAIGAMDYLKSVDEERKRKEDLISGREDALLDLYVKKGGTTSADTDKKQSAAEAAFKLQERIDGSGIQDEETLNYLNNIVSDPFAAQEVLEFINEQATDYDRIINLQDLRTMIDIVKAPTSVDDKIDLFKEFDVVDLSNKEEYYKLAKKINSMTTKGGRTVFVDVKPGAIAKTDFTAREKQFEGVLQNVIRTARAGLENDPDKIQTQNALNNLSSSDAGTKADARDYLLSRFITPEFIKSLEEENSSAYRGLSKNHLIKPYLTTSLPQNQTTYPIPTQKHIESLKNNPDRKAEFEEKFGPGSADRYLKND